MAEELLIINPCYDKCQEKIKMKELFDTDESNTVSMTQINTALIELNIKVIEAAGKMT